MRPLTRAEAVERRRLLDVESYRVDLDLRDATTGTDFESRTVVRFRCTAGGSDTFADLKAERLLDVELNGQPLDPATWRDGRLPLGGLSDHNELVVRARFAYSRTGEGLHRFVDPADGEVYLYSQAFLDDAPRMFACFDQPDLKAPVTLTVSAPPGWTVLGNEAGEETEPGRWEFDPTRPLSTYMVAVVAGPYQGVRAHHDGIDVGVWCRASMRPFLDEDRMLETTRRGLDHYRRLFAGPYPFGKYDEVMVPEFNAGAMENPGLVTFRDELFMQRGNVTAEDRGQLAVVQLHEMAHMWFGNLVTMRWWDDLWLNESFADYMGHRVAVDATEHTDEWLTFLMRRKAWGYRADQLSTTHPVAGEVDDTAQALLNFDGISYAKGASALRQLVEWVGDDAFIAGLREHFAAHAYGNATLSDLVGALSRSSGRDVAAWAERWLRTTGVSTLAVRAGSGSDRYENSTVVQSDGGTLRPHRIRIGLYDLDETGTLNRRRLVATDVAAANRTPVPALDGERPADLVLPNDGDLTFALLDLDERSAATVRSHLGGLRDPMARALLWTSLWEDVGHGRLAPSEFVRLVVTVLGPLDPDLVLTPTLQRATTAASVLAAPASRGHLLASLAAFARRSGDAAEPGGDRQLQLARTFVDVCQDPATLQALLDGQARWRGLRVDSDLRWRAVQRLATLGAADDADLEAEYERDHSSSGHLHSLTARAARPLPEAKEAAWRGAMEGSLSNHELFAVGRGFWQVDQDDVLEPYVQRFAEDFPQLSASASAQTVQTFGRFFFPTVRVHPSTVELAERLLTDAGLDAPAARIVAESRDDIARFLRARAAEPV
ncbi:MAG TPA: aminopeptidase N [Actinomycetales bacterium]|nr:aminopeptidase N [Actinomycetales bacterium]